MNEYALFVLRQHGNALYSGRLVSGSRRCGVGWLLHAAGVSDEEMKMFDSLNLNRPGYYLLLYSRYRAKLQRFGITSPSQLMQWIVKLDQRGVRALSK
jgi:hypothetical protein